MRKVELLSSVSGVDFVDCRSERHQPIIWGLFRDRWPDLYSALLTADGKV
jgi:hypothetical protein